MHRDYFVATIYLIGTLALAYSIHRAVSKTCEAFATEKTITPLCMSCMDYFHDVLQYTDPGKIVPYIKQRSEYLMFILDQFVDFMENNTHMCPKKGTELTTTDVVKCFPAVIEKFMGDCVRATNDRAECAIISRLGDKVLVKAQECGATPCTLPQFRARFKEALRAMAVEIDTCRRAFETADSECSKVYAQVILAKTRPADPLDASLANIADPAAAVTNEQMRKHIGDVTAFMMTSFA